MWLAHLHCHSLSRDLSFASSFLVWEWTLRPLLLLWAGILSGCAWAGLCTLSVWDLCIFPIVSGKWCSLKIIHTSGSYNLSAPSLTSLSFEGRNTIKTSYSGLNAPKSLFLHTVPLWLSVNLIYCKRKLLWWRLSDAVLYVGNSMSLGVVLLRTVRIIVVRSPLGPWPTVSQDLCLVWVHLTEWLLNPTQRCLWTCKFMSFLLKKTKTNKIH